MDNDQVSVVPIVLALFAIVALVLFVAMMGFFVFLFSRAVKRRSYDQARGQQMQQAAASIGFGFQAQAHLSALPFLSSFELFEGYPLRLENLMTGKLDHRDAVVFDLAYRNVGSRGGGGSTTSRQTLFAVTSRDLNLPEFYLRPEGALEKVLNAVSRVDIDFAERPGFSQRFLLYGKDERSIRWLFTPPTLDFFEQNPNLCAFGRGNHLFLYQSRTPAAPEQVPRHLQFLSFAHDLLRR